MFLPAMLVDATPELAAQDAAMTACGALQTLIDARETDVTVTYLLLAYAETIIGGQGTPL